MGGHGAGQLIATAPPAYLPANSPRGRPPGPWRARKFLLILILATGRVVSTKLCHESRRGGPPGSGAQGIVLSAPDERTGNVLGQALARSAGPAVHCVQHADSLTNSGSRNTPGSLAGASYDPTVIRSESSHRACAMARAG